MEVQNKQTTEIRQAIVGKYIWLQHKKYIISGLDVCTVIILNLQHERSFKCKFFLELQVMVNNMFHSKIGLMME